MLERGLKVNGAPFQTHAPKKMQKNFTLTEQVATKDGGMLGQLHIRHCVRAVKEMDSKSIGLCPQGFESPRCRSSTILEMQIASRSTSSPWSELAKL